MELTGWQWRYGIISRLMRVPNRPKDWFDSGQYVAVRIEDEYLPGRVIGIIGDHPPIIEVCMYQGRKLCQNYLKGCESTCMKRLLTTSDHAGVLNLADILFILENPKPKKEPVDPRYDLLIDKKFKELFCLIDNLEGRQKNG